MGIQMTCKQIPFTSHLRIHLLYIVHMIEPHSVPLARTLPSQSVGLGSFFEGATLSLPLPSLP